jgi:hypothetical protein
VVSGKAVGLSLTCRLLRGIYLVGSCRLSEGRLASMEFSETVHDLQLSIELETPRCASNPNVERRAKNVER